MAIVVDDVHVVTCCHVLNDVLRRKNRLDPESPPSESEFDIQFPYVKGVERKGKVAVWGLKEPLGQDVALLRLIDGEAPRDAEAATFTSAEVRGRSWLCSGYDADGIVREASGECAGLLPNGFRQLNGTDGLAARVVGGYSGGAVWIDSLERVAGMVVAKDVRAHETGLAYAVPLDAIASVLPSRILNVDDQEYAKSNARAPREPHISRDVLLSLIDRHGQLDAVRTLKPDARVRILIVQGPRDAGHDFFRTRLACHWRRDDIEEIPWNHRSVEVEGLVGNLKEYGLDDRERPVRDPAWALRVPEKELKRRRLSLGEFVDLLEQACQRVREDASLESITAIVLLQESPPAPLGTVLWNALTAAFKGRNANPGATSDLSQTSRPQTQRIVLTLGRVKNTSDIETWFWDAAVREAREEIFTKKWAEENLPPDEEITYEDAVSACERALPKKLPTRR